MRKQRKTKNKLVSILKTGTDYQPDFDKIKVSNPNYQKELTNALNYASSRYNTRQKKKFAQEYVKENLNDYSISHIPDSFFCHIGSVCWILKNGGEIENINYYENQIKQLSKKFKKKKTKTQKHKNTENVIAILEESIDQILIKPKKYKNSIESILESEDVYITKIKKHFERQLHDFEKYKKDYNHLTQKQKKLLLNFYKKVLENNNKHEERKPRKKRKRKPETIVKALRYKKEDEVLNIKSFNPVKILGAKWMYIFNTKNRKLAYYESDSPEGFDLYRCKLLNFCQEKSVEKTVRKPQDFFIDFLSYTSKKKKAQKFKSLKTKEKENTGRINSNHVLLCYGKK